MTVLVATAIGIGVGAFVTGAFVLLMMRSRMVVPQRSEQSFEATCAAIESEVPGDGWGFPMEPLDMTGQLREKGVAPDGIERIRLYFVCNPRIAGRVLSHTPAMAGIMPCSWAVIEKNDHSVWLAKMNVGLMAKMFPAPIRHAMGQVASADERFMASVLTAKSPGAVGCALKPQVSTES